MSIFPYTRKRLIRWSISNRLFGVLAGITNTPWELIFIFDTYACRRGKGNHLAVQRLQKFTRSLTTNGIRQAYFLQLDIRNFFVANHKETLYKIIADKDCDENILWLARVIIST